jgi:hypothetical protein
VAGLAQHHHPRVAGPVDEDVQIAGIKHGPGKRRDLVAVACHPGRIRAIRIRHTSDLTVAAATLPGPAIGASTPQASTTP